MVSEEPYEELCPRIPEELRLILDQVVYDIGSLFLENIWGNRQ